MFRKWLYNWLTNDRVEKQYAVECSPPVSNSGLRQSKNNNMVTFRLYAASGGKIIEAYTLDKKTGDDNISLYVIPDSEDFNESLSKIITMEHLKL